MSLQSKNNFSKGLNLDFDPLRIPPDTAVFIKNLTNNINLNQGAAGASGQNKFVFSPLEGNQAINITLPTGNNYCIGCYSSEQTNELYFALYNSSNNHSIWVISGTDGAVTKVHQSALLPFVLDPQYFLSEGRMTIMLKSYVDTITQVETNFKFLVLTNNNGLQVLIDVNASIATNSYTTPYFTASAAFYNPLELIHLGPTLPIKAIGLNTPTPYVPTSADASKQNLLINAGWQFRIRTWDIWGRPTDWGIISSVFTVLTGGGCISTSNGLARCVNLSFDAGNPLVKFITVAYRRGVGNDPTGQTETGWLESETFRKYDDSTPGQWYNRSINPIFTTAGSGITFNAGTNVITYTFCADKQSNPVDPIEAAITEPGIARLSSTVAAIEQNLLLANNSYNFQPIDQDVIEDIDFAILPPTAATCPAAPLRTITFYSAIYKPQARDRGFIRTSFNKVVFGDTSGDCGTVGAFSMDEVFADQENPGFIAVLRGTNFKCICQQGNIDPATGAFVPLGWGSAISAGTNIVQQYTFTGVPAGKYIAQISSHKSKIRDSNLQQTSTYVGGLSVISDLATPGGIITYAGNPIKEIAVDCSVTNVNLNNPTDNIFTILDLVTGGGSVAVDGYLYEQNGSDVPVEMAPISLIGLIGGSPADIHGSFFTDHNGFYFGVAIADTIRAYMFADFPCTGSMVNVDIYGSFNTALPYTHQDDFTRVGVSITHGDGTGSSGGCAGVTGNWFNKVYFFPTTGTYPDAARRRFVQPITLCGDPTTGIPGIPVVMTKVGPFEFTNSAGIATLIAHNRYNWDTATSSVTAPYLPYVTYLSGMVPDYSTSPNNQDQLIFSQNGGCEWNVCGGCDTFMANVTVTYLACSAPPSGCAVTGMIATARIVNVGTNYVNGDTFNIVGATTNATGKVLSASGGHVTAILIITPGSGFAFPGVYATVATTGIGTALSIEVLTTLPADRTLCLTGLSVQPNGIGIKGLQSGGKYPVALWFHDFSGRHTAPQIKQGELGFVYTPNLNDTTTYPYPTMALCGLQLIIPTGLTVDPVFTHLTALVAPNALFYDFFSWSADAIQYVDNTGATNPTNPTAIRIYFASLNEYNKLYAFKTNVTWDFIAQSIGQTSPSDVVQFIMNGDGTWLPSVKGAAVTYDQYGTFFTIAYQPELAGLQNGCLFRIIRPKQTTTSISVPYYEQCLTIPITGGNLPAGTYIIPYVDSYLLSRSIPVPLLKGQPGPIPPGGNPPNAIQTTSTNQNTTLDTDGYSQNNIENSNQALIFQIVDFQAVFPFFFESPSPSDLWGSHLSCQGRVGIPDPYEQQTRIGTEIAVSNPLSNQGFVNGIGTFLDANKQIFSRNAWGDITVILVETSVLLVICNSDHFILRYGGSNVFVDPNTGNVLSRNAQGIFQAPERKSGVNYGCTPYNINTIRRWAGTVRWLDNSGFLVLHNFSTADSNTDDAGYLAYLLQKIAEVNIQNLSSRMPKPIIWFHGSIDPKTSEYYLTRFLVPGGGGSASYINPLSQPAPLENETFIFDLKSLVLKGFASFTPEYYGLMPKFYSQRQFFSFKQGIPYIHHNNYNNNLVAPPPPFANFYGTQCEVRITHVVNGVDGKMLPDKVKRFFYVEVYCNSVVDASPPTSAFPSALFYADLITTESGQVSRILVPRWTYKNGVWCAAFLCDLNSAFDPNLIPQTTSNVILDGNPLIGRYLIESLVSQPGYLGSYFEISEVVVYTDFVEKSAE